MRIGIMGGTFNPVHFGHLNAAEEIRERFFLDKVIFIPTFIPPHKEQSGILSPSDRMHMLKSAVCSNNHFTVSEIEIERKGISYSIDSVRAIKKEMGRSADIFFISGIDVFKDISTWKNPDKLLQSCNFIVHTRPGYKNLDVVNLLDKKIASEYNVSFKSDEQDEDCFVERIAVLRTEYSIYFTQILLFDISSTAIRQRILEGKSIKYLLPNEVERYIVEKGLYTAINNKL